MDFFGAEGFGKGAGLFAREVEIGGGIGGDEVLTAEPGEEASHAAEACDLGVDDEGFTSTWGAVVEEVVLIFCKISAGEVFDLGM